MGGVNICDSLAGVAVPTDHFHADFTALLSVLEEAAFSVGGCGPYTLGARMDSV